MGAKSRLRINKPHALRSGEVFLCAQFDDFAREANGKARKK